jgi:hypothetical protein
MLTPKSPSGLGPLKNGKKEVMGPVRRKQDPRVCSENTGLWTSTIFLFYNKMTHAMSLHEKTPMERGTGTLGQCPDSARSQEEWIVKGPKSSHMT